MKNFEEVRKEIKQKKSELMALSDKLNELGKDRYNFLVGKYFSLAATCKIKVTEISSIDENFDSLTVDCILVEGGKHGNANITIEMEGFYDLKISEIEKNEYREITREEFNKFIEEWIEEVEKIFEINEYHNG